MAPLTSTSTPTTMANLVPTLKPEEQSFAGDEFSNNLFSDLAPLLTLFGEQVWIDIFRVMHLLSSGGECTHYDMLNGCVLILGSARESLAAAEQELLSSTSDDVCEMWSGTDIVRQLGKPRTKELIVVKNDRASIPRVLGLAQAIESRYMHETDKGGRYLSTPERLASQAPNIALNAEGSLVLKKELWFWAIVGITLQLVAIVFPALATYLWKFSKAGSDVQDYAYPCFVAGTLAIVFGVILCSHVIEGVTDERTYEAKTPQVSQVTRLQLACTVSDQSFKPFLIMNPPGDKRIQMSRLLRRPERQLSRLAGFASIMTVAGFIVQFVGLRGLHWSATIFQLGVTLTMTGARSWVRRGLSAEVPCVQLKPMYELEMTALLFLQHPSEIPSKLSGNHIPKCKIITGRELQLCHKRHETPTVETENGLPSFTESALTLRQDLADIMPITTNGDKITQMTSKLVKSMTKILECYENAIKDRRLQKYAVEIFSGFMNSLTESIETVGGSTKIVGTFSIQSPYRDDRDASVKENSVLMSFSQALVDSGLVKKIWEAKALIIPPFANRGLLPTESGDIMFDEPVRKPNSRSSAQSSSTISVGSAQREPVDQSKQATVSGPTKETIEDNERSESQVESVTKGETVTDNNERVNKDQEELAKDGLVAHSSQSARSAPEGEDYSK
ncbi:uncharacterized protein yc1106_05585 [Curvularia clavata]|uniref:Uncharacterized protein n=1 Tax=Curvularia clavata TaxID=95742 RepID=A0A9Q8Z8C2_CURCL|nr:uncharacterized protein yc1106_05585 [Curvularia clavata]